MGVALVLCAGLFLSWRGYTPAPPPASIAAFDVAPPAAPPRPVREVPPGPEQVKRDKSVTRPERIAPEPPQIALPSENTVIAALPSPPTPQPGAPVKETTAPVSTPAPPAPRVSSSRPTWHGLVLGALEKVRRYPRDARFARQQGVPYIRFTMNRRGKVLSAVLERSSGYRSLDQEALALPRRAEPLPPPPDDVPGDPIELLVPVEFFMR
ncbi:TonB family protein [Novosphingobium resinovorum]|uniref:energy transducer TonB n=1 Tax=Novosphingobium resinovorum TaxID=158500 RepID=UPI002ED1DD7C|nr:TonB family protein [Novosphingobium resinovorum]